MKRSREEAEVVVRLDFMTQKINIYVAAWPSMAAKMTKLYGPSIDGKSEMSRRWVVPMGLVSFRRPKVAGLAVRTKTGKPFPKKAILHAVAEQQVAV
jgi:hypothetical protein